MAVAEFRSSCGCDVGDLLAVFLNIAAAVLKCIIRGGG